MGGNAGHYAYYLSRLTRQVHVFEPNPSCLTELHRILRRNMILHDVALSDSRGQATLRFDPANSGVGTIESANRMELNPTIHSLVEHTVKTRPLDDYDLRDVGFIKVDVEGHEPTVLRGGIRLIERERPVMLVEIERRHNPTAFEEVEYLLAPFGYTAWRLSGGSLVPVRREQIGDLQQLPAENNPAYVNNFLFLPANRLDLLHTIGRHG